MNRIVIKRRCPLIAYRNLEPYTLNLKPIYIM